MELNHVLSAPLTVTAQEQDTSVVNPVKNVNQPQTYVHVQNLLIVDQGKNAAMVSAKIRTKNAEDVVEMI